MIETTKHKFRRPELKDDVVDTIQNLNYDLQKLDELIDESTGSLSTFLKEGQQYSLAKRIWNEVPTIGDYAGWINVKTGIYAPAWKKNTVYTIGELVVPNSNNGHVYRCVENGTSGNSQPNFPLTSRSRVSDIAGSKEWEGDYVYSTGDIVFARGDNQRLYHYRCISSGVSSGTEPVWNETTGTTIVDGSVQWQTYKTAVWEEFGGSCNFRGFGKIE